VPLAQVEALLKRTMGLDAASIGVSAIERAVQQRLAACKLPDAASYWERLRGSELELQELIEAVVVPETWFFRDREAFAALVQLVRQEWLPAHPDGTLRLLSLPCATGEEPYSMAIALADAGFPAGRLRIDAIDISVRALARAAEGVYTRNSFRGGDYAFRDRHFEETPQGFRVTAAIRAPVHFERANLLAAGFRPGVDLYDMIFCRNVLIYFDRPTQDRALAVLSRLLTPAGVLFVAPSETGLLLDHRFVSAQLPLAFAFRKPDLRPRPAPAPPPLALALQRPTPTRVPQPQPSAAARPVIAPTAPAAAKAPPPAAPATDLAEAGRLADAGRLAEARQICRAHLRDSGPSAQAYYLLGLIGDASGEAIEAADAYRRALYLDPQHRDALLQLAVLLDRHGDTRAAQVMRDRARRHEGRGS
jgi:chemotaxis protein methyltransferase WspC